MKYGKFVPPTKYVLNKNPFFFFLSAQFNAERKFCGESSFQWKTLPSSVADTSRFVSIILKFKLINLIIKQDYKEKTKLWFNQVVAHFWLNIQDTTHQSQQFSQYNINISTCKKRSLIHVLDYHC